MGVPPSKMPFESKASTDLLHDKSNTFLHPFSPTFLLRTMWLLTYSDLTTFVLPETMFAYFSAISPLAVAASTDNISPLVGISLRLPKIILWTWLNTLIFNLANQRQEDAILEDRINKPWRPLPSGRLSPAQARHLLMAVIPLVLTTTQFLGGFQETALLFVLNWVYNDLGAADENGLLRNLTIAVAYMLYGLGALKVACGADHCTVNSKTYTWLYMIGLLILTTMHVQDLKDIDGDRARDRKTLPIVMGQEASRWSIAIAVLCWSVICPRFWNVHWLAYVTVGILGLLVAGRVVTLRSFEGDRTTWKLWACWLTTCYTLPSVNLIFENLII